MLFKIIQGARHHTIGFGDPCHLLLYDYKFRRPISAFVPSMVTCQAAPPRLAPWTHSLSCFLQEYYSMCISLILRNQFSYLSHRPGSDIRDREFHHHHLIVMHSVSHARLQISVWSICSFDSWFFTSVHSSSVKMTKLFIFKYFRKTTLALWDFLLRLEFKKKTPLTSLTIPFQ